MHDRGRNGNRGRGADDLDEAAACGGDGANVDDRWGSRCRGSSGGGVGYDGGKSGGGGGTNVDNEGRGRGRYWCGGSGSGVDGGAGGDEGVVNDVEAGDVGGRGRGSRRRGRDDGRGRLSDGCRGGNDSCRRRRCRDCRRSVLDDVSSCSESPTGSVSSTYPARKTWERPESPCWRLESSESGQAARLSIGRVVNRWSLDCCCWWCCHGSGRCCYCYCCGWRRSSSSGEAGQWPQVVGVGGHEAAQCGERRRGALGLCSDLLGRHGQQDGDERAGRETHRVGRRWCCRE